MNCDGVVDGYDVQPFILALTDLYGPNGYYAQYPHCNHLNGDMNGDGVVDGFDQQLFVAYLSGHGGATGMRCEYVWDAENRLIVVVPLAPEDGDKKVEFAYDYMGRRVEKRVSVWDTSLNPDDWNPAHDDAYVRRFVWAGVGTDGWLMLMELSVTDPGGPNETMTALRKYTWGLDLAGQSGVAADVSSAGGVGHGGPALQAAGGIGGLLAVDQAEVGGGYSQGGIDAGQYVFFYDANGNVGQLVNLSAQTAQAAIVAHYEYDPYGDVIRTTGDYADDNAIRFSTKYFDAETGLGYWGYRYYSPRLGRWVSRDPAGEVGGLNLYGYVLNDSVGHIDPLGLWQRDMHYTATYEAARAAGMRHECAETIAEWNQGVDTWTGSAVAPQYHFDLDVDGRPFECGRDCWYHRRWGEGERLLDSGGCKSVMRGLRRIGEALHSYQDGFAHNKAHHAATPFDHAPALFCFLWGDPLGMILPRCRDAARHNPNWMDAQRPDRRHEFPEDFERAKQGTVDLLKRLMSSHWCLRCCCRDSTGGTK